LAHGQWRIAYDYRGDGPNIANLSGDFATELDSGVLPKSLLDIALQAREKLGFEVNAAAPVEPRTGGVVQVDRRQWVVNSDRPDQFLIEEVAPKHFSIRSWRNWYDFPGSYWRYDNQRKSPIDRGEPDQVKYLLHMVVGHHGVLSLTPIFVLSVLGVIPICFNGRYRFRFIGLMTLALTVVVFAFYVRLDGADRNYGGMTSGLRWMFWLYPFWLVWMVPVLEWSSRRTILLLVCVLLLAASVASAAYSFENPWVHPWLYEVLKNRGIPV
jgi:hypothetical protein